METEETVKESFDKEFGDEQKYDWNEVIQNHVKIVVVGERGCGKSSLILAAKNQIFPHPEENFVSKQCPLDVEVDGKTEACMVVEADSGDDSIHSRSRIYSETDIILLCFDDIKTLTGVERKWVRELKDHVPGVPIILVRIKKMKQESDILSSELTELESFSGLLECWPHARKGVREVFQEAVKKAHECEICEKK
ncbi:ras-like GTP-binding protein O-RHO [Argiope bruennichi]|uniref:ras-like GTP-binding protein O-RHO n=1 Tax=Argiope bruennichi TaxID=94029 RepID=UPI0024959CB7|nr:ras-like GTP-binding protein O-RHO [Argiope bruennichi]